jgi:hypothetical protein
MGPTLEDEELSTLFEPTEGLHQLTIADSKLLV